MTTPHSAFRTPHRHLPAEWEPHEATWLAWPHNEEDWPGKLAAVEWVYGEIVRHLVIGEQVRILVNDAAEEERGRGMLKRVGVDLNRVEFFEVPTNRSWTRDYGPIFVRSDPVRRAGGVNPLMGGAAGDPPRSGDSRPPLAVARFRFNGWAKYDDWQLDDAVPKQLTDRIGMPLSPIMHDGKHVVLEGGAIDVNGAGTLLATEECLLEVGRIGNPSDKPSVQVRNPGMTREEMETVFAQSLGATNVIWLGQGIAGDDTHGHVDDLCRFVNQTTVVLAQESDPRDENYAPLQENRERLRSARLEDGSRIEVVNLPMPGPLYFDGIRLPASYANFYIANAAVLVPTFNDPADRIALGILADLFPDRPVIGIHAVDLVWGLGTLHCLTQQQPVGGGPNSAETQS